MKISKIEIRKDILLYYLLYTLMLLRYMLPSYFETKLSNFNLLGVLQLGTLTVLFIYLIMAPKVLSRPLIWVGLYSFSLVISTQLNKGDSTTALIHATEVILICFVVNTIIISDIKTQVFLRVIRDITLVFFLMNIIMNIRFPNGIPSITVSSQSPNFLYGNINSTIKHLLPGMCCSSIIDFKNKKIISFVSGIFYLGIFFQAFYVYFTATAVIAAIFLILWIIIIPKYRLNKRVIYIGVLISLVVVELTIVFPTEFRSSIAALFGKSADFSGRAFLWENTILLIKENKWFGYGLIDGQETLKMIGNMFGSHNYYLDILFQRGIFGAFFMLIIMIYPLFYWETTNKNLNGIDILIGYSIACLIMFLAEPFYSKEFLVIPIFFVTMIMLNNINFKKYYVFKMK